MSKGFFYIFLKKKHQLLLNYFMRAFLINKIINNKKAYTIYPPPSPPKNV